MTRQPLPPRELRPRCVEPGCQSPAQFLGSYTVKTGQPQWRKYCSRHHDHRTAEKHGKTSISQILAERKGFTTVADYRNSTHRYLQHRLDYCENRDSRFGYACNYPVQIKAQLQVDHIDGDPDNNRPENLQTLCANCHIYKTHQNRDYATPGRTVKRRLRERTDQLFTRLFEG
jgi:hypothetical protein